MGDDKKKWRTGTSGPLWKRLQTPVMDGEEGPGLISNLTWATSRLTSLITSMTASFLMC